MYAVIMAGGSGTRFWPLSRRRRPKQLLSLFGDKPMIAETVDRLAGLVPPERVLVVTNEALAEAVRAALPSVPAENVLCEPMGRNTAPCVGMAAAAVRAAAGPEEVMVVLPADHYIRDAETFRGALAAAAAEAETGAIVTLGIEPTKPETGYGYIRCGEALADGVHAVDQFVEKPDHATALAYLQSGDYVWNSGMFCFRVDRILREFETQLPRLAGQIEEMAAALGPDDADTLRDIFERIEPVSIDYGIMEGAANVRVLPVSFGWSDVGHWDALPSVTETDSDGNVRLGDVVALDCEGCVLVSGGSRVLSAVGLDHVVVVDTEDALLVAPRQRVQEVRRVVDALRERPDDLT